MSKAWSRGWLVSVAGSDRNTPYVASEAELEAALHSAPAAISSRESTLQQLEAFAGRRVLVVVGTTGVKPVPASASRTLPEIYVVDGGVRTGHTFDPIYLFGPCNATALTGIAAPQACGGDTPFGAQGNPQLSPSVSTEDRGNGFSHGIWHGRTLAAAVSQMFRESDRYFDLQADVPTTALGSPFDLKFRKLPEGVHLKADAYSEQGGRRESEPRLVLGQ